MGGGERGVVDLLRQPGCYWDAVGLMESRENLE